MGKRVVATAAFRPVFVVALVVQLGLVVAGLVAVFWGSNYLEEALRRSVEEAALVAAHQWQENLRLVAPYLEVSRVAEAFQKEGRDPHLLPIPMAKRARLLPLGEGAQTGTVLTRRIREGEESFMLWPGGFASGLLALVAVKASAACQRCHEEFAEGKVVGVLELRVGTPFLQSPLASRRANLKVAVATTLAVLSGLLWTVALVAARRVSRLDAARQEALGRLAASENLFRSLVEHSLVGVYLIQGDRFLYVNPRFAEMFGYTQEEILHRLRVPDLVAPEDRELVADNLRKRFAGEVESVRYSFTALRADGTRFPVEVFGALTVLPTGPAVVGMIVDNSEKEQARRFLEAAYRAVVGLPGQDPFSAAARSLANLLQVPVVFVTELVGEELLVLGAEGPVRGTRLPLAQTPCEAVVRCNAPLAISEGFSARYDASSFVPMVPQAYLGMPLPASDGKVLGVLAVLSEKPRVFNQLEQQVMEIYATRLGRELERIQLLRREKLLEEELAEREKLAALGALAGGIAHDFNNVLAGIVGEAELLGRTLPAAYRAQLQRLVELAQRGGEVVNKILAFARKELPAKQPLNMRRLLTETAELARHTLGPKVQLVLEVSGEPWVVGDASGLQQALLHLLINARDAMPGGGSVVLRAWQEDQTVILHVQDTGVGIPKELLPRVFEPFFTTKPADRGTGLGLATVYRTVQAHGGEVGIASRIGEGTTVTIRLPAAPPEATAEQPKQVKASLAGKHILVVDDEPEVLESLTELLRLEGAKVLAAGSGEHALLLVGEGSLDAAVLDMLMPGMNGAELARELLARQPDLPLVVSSGHAPEPLWEALLHRPGTVFLQKPYRIAELVSALASLLGARS